MNKTITIDYEEYLELQNIKNDFDKILDQRFKEALSKHEFTLLNNALQNHKKELETLTELHRDYVVKVDRRFDNLSKEYSWLDGIAGDYRLRVDNYNKLNWFQRIFNKV